MDAAIEISGLTKRFGTVEAVSGVNLTVEDGTSFGYLGPNGAGKTTTIRCMLGFITPSAGTIKVFGKDVTTDLGSILGDVGHLPGEFGLWPSLTGRETLAHLGRLHPSPPTRRAELCDRFELAQQALDRPVRSYSRGMKQKIGLIQAFQHDPRLVVLDEPTEGLDPVMKERFVDLLAEHERQGGTTFLSSHILSEVERTTDRVAIIRNGSVVALGATGSVTGERIRKCTVVLVPGSSTRFLDLEGVSEIARRDGTHVTFRFSGQTDLLLRAMTEASVEDVLIEPESLSDTFFDVFEGGGEQT